MDAPTLVTVIVPIYNEQDTVGIVIDSILELDLVDVELEIVIVESNSLDRSREILDCYASHPRVCLILQDEARGKGYAVREGLKHVLGDIIIIQDGDLEYCVSDYQKLLDPILRGETDFVLGSPGRGDAPMREMPDEPINSLITNLGHRVFTAFFNLVYSTSLEDPFTMYKVFRTRCITGVPFHANRFDFDWELVGKLVRLGNQPLEVPVTYNSRGFRSGKKIRPLRDPITWLVAALRYRFERLPK